jgi:hypothetical protein
MFLSTFQASFQAGQDQPYHDRTLAAARTAEWKRAFGSEGTLHEAES